MKQIYVVTGSPGSGKSTYAKKNAGANDIVFDLDEINKALGGGLHEENRKSLGVALAMRSAAIEELAKKEGPWERAFFITASPDKEEIRKLCEALGAEEIRMETTLEQCKENILRDDTRADKGKYIELAEKWHRGSENMNIDEVKAQISERTGVPVSLLTGETAEENIAQAKALLVFKRRSEEERPKSTREQFAAWYKEREGIPEEDAAMEALAQIERSAASYPIVSDGGEVTNMPDARPTKEQFADFMGQKMQLKPGEWPW